MPDHHTPLTRLETALLGFLDSVAFNPKLDVELNIAAGIASQELRGNRDDWRLAKMTPLRLVRKVRERV